MRGRAFSFRTGSQRWRQALIAFAALEVAAFLAVGWWGRSAFQREHGDVLLHLLTVVAGHAATACLFLLAGRRDRRTRLLGVFFLLKATAVSPFAFSALLRADLPVDPTGLGGTVRYLSPAVLSGRPADEADDVWSLCVMLHEMATGQHPFAARGRRGAGPHSASASRPRPDAGGLRPGLGRCRVRGIGADGSPFGPPGDRAHLGRRAARHSTRRVPDVAKKVGRKRAARTRRLVGNPQAACPQALVLDRLDVAEPQPGASHRFRPRDAVTHQVLRVGVEVKPHLLVERVLEVLASDQGGQERAETREHVTLRRGSPPSPR